MVVDHLFRYELSYDLANEFLFLFVFMFVCRASHPCFYQSELCFRAHVNFAPTYLAVNVHASARVPACVRRS